MSPAGSYAEAWVVGLSRYRQSLNQGHGGSSEGSLFLKEKTSDDASGENSGGVISDRTSLSRKGARCYHIKVILDKLICI